MTPADRDSIVGWLRAMAQRLARENRADLGRVRSQLEIINALARRVLAVKAGTMKRDVRVCMKADQDDRKITCGYARGHKESCSWGRMAAPGWAATLDAMCPVVAGGAKLRAQRVIRQYLGGMRSNFSFSGNTDGTPDPRLDDLPAEVVRAIPSEALLKFKNCGKATVRLIRRVFPEAVTVQP